MFKCMHCCSLFYREFDLKRHVEWHHGAGTACTQTFNHIDVLKTHLKTAHDDDNEGVPPNGGGPSTVVNGESRSSTVYRDEMGYEYHLNWEVCGTRYLRCAYFGCGVTARMGLDAGSVIVLGPQQHIHHPNSQRSLEVRMFLNTLRERGGSENVTPAQIYNETAPQNIRAALAVGHQTSIRTIARARRRVSPPIPETLEEWANILVSDEWQQRLLWCDGTNNRFYQGRLDVVQGGVTRFVGLVFSNISHLISSNIHLASVRTLCIDGTYQVRPTHPPDIAQLMSVVIIVNNVAVPIMYALLTESTTEAYCRLLQFVRNDSQLNLNFEELQIISDFEQGLRNAIMMVMPESNNSGCWFYFVRCIIRFIRSNRIIRLCNTNADARRVVRMLMALPHLPAETLSYNGIDFSIELGFRNIQNLVEQHGLNNSLNSLMAYFQHYWMEVVGAHRFTVHRLTHRTNNFIESYHASLLRRMGQHPALYVFYNHLRGIEQQSRIDFSSAIDGLPVRRTTSSMYTRNMGILGEAWQHVENGRYTLLEFQRRTAHTAEQILLNEIGEPIFNENNIQDILINIPPLPMPPLPIDVQQALPILLRPRGRGLGRAGRRRNVVIPLDDVHGIPARGGSPERHRSPERRGSPEIRESPERLRDNGRRYQWNVFYQNMENYDYNILQENDAQQPANPIEPVIPDTIEICIICADNEALVTMMPCRHIFCNICVLRLIQDRSIVRCPICRSHPEHYVGLVL